LPAGLTLVGNIISGMPTASGSVTVVAQNACGTSAPVTITIDPCATPTVSAGVVSGTVGLPFLSTLALSPGATLSVTGLPAGLTLNGNIISGTPTASGTAKVTVTAACGAQATLGLTIAPCAAPTIAADTLMGTVGLPFLSTVIAAPGATITATGLPAGLT